MGDMGQAERLYRAAVKLKENTPRAAFGLSRLLRAASFYRSARLTCLKAHSIDPDDALITKSFINYVPAGDLRAEVLVPFAKAHPWLFEHYQEDSDSTQAIRNSVQDKPLFETEGGPQETTLHFVLLMHDANHPRAVGLEFKIGNGRKLHMLFDTGASGIVLKQSAVGKIGLEHMGSGVAWGVGDKGTRSIFSALADTCELGNLKFRNCLVNAMERKRGISDQDDGLIGADFFRDYVLEIDFQKRLLHLKPLPPRPANPQGFDRTIPPDEANFTPVFRLGHWLLITTHVNKKATGLFLLDTGAEISAMDATFARLSTKIHDNDWIRVGGVSGSVKDVYQADKADSQFGHFEQNNIGLTTYNINNMPEHQEIRMAGIVGLPVLQFFRLTIDYRNGLVNFDYVYK